MCKGALNRSDAPTAGTKQTAKASVPGDVVMSIGGSFFPSGSAPRIRAGLPGTSVPVLARSRRSTWEHYLPRRPVLVIAPSGNASAASGLCHVVAAAARRLLTRGAQPRCLRRIADHVPLAVTA